jgi:hypothetical protein
MQSIPQQLKSWRRRLSDSGAPDYCIAEHEQARDWADFVLAQLRDEMLHLGEDYRRMWEVWHCETAPTTLTPHLIHVWTISARMAALGGWFALSLEVVITGMLSIILLDLPALGAFFVVHKGSAGPTLYSAGATDAIENTEETSDATCRPNTNRAAAATRRIRAARQFWGLGIGICMAVPTCNEPAISDDAITRWFSL